MLEECVIVFLVHFWLVETKVIGCHFHHNIIPVGTLVLNVHKLTAQTKKKVQKFLRNKFAIIFEGWEDGDTHYVFVFAAYSSDLPSD